MNSLAVAVPLLVSLFGGLALWHRGDCGDGVWDDVWAIITLAPIIFVLVIAALG